MEKKRGGGGQPEAFDPNTGKYVADGQPNKYYDNPEEKGINNYTKAPNGKSLTELFGDIFGEENEEINSMFGYTGEEKAETFEDKYSKPISEMSQEELLKEIGEHKEWLLENNVDLQVKCFDQDLKLKCANLREMHRLFEKYPFFSYERLGHSVLINQRKMSRRHGDCVMFDWDGINYRKLKVTISDRIRFNSESFKSFEETNKRQTREIEAKFKNDVSDAHKPCYTFTHEFGHLLASQLSFNSIKDKIKTNEYLEWTEGVASINFVGETSETFHERAYNEVLQIYLQDNPSAIDFARINSDYSKRNKREWFAETFSSYEGGKPHAVAIAFGKWLEKELEKIRGE